MVFKQAEHIWKTQGRTITIVLCALCVLLGAYDRFYNVWLNEFIYYDEGYYLNFNRIMMEKVASQMPLSWTDVWKTINISSIVSAGSTKALWMFLIDMRVFFVKVTDWFFPRLLSAIFGMASIALTYLFASRYYGSKSIGLWSAAVLALFPSHIYYSRLALQEPLSTLCFLAGFYFYLFPRKFGPRTFLAGALFGVTYFTNYRLIILPLMIALAEWLDSYASREQFSVRKYVWAVLIFFFFIFFIGNFGRAENTYTTFSWMFHQANMAKSEVSLLNFLSYPYYLFRLESFFLGVLFFGHLWVMARYKPKEVIPFALACFQMFLFSFAYEKGVRYICVVTPFIAMSACYTAYMLFKNVTSFKVKGLVVAVFSFMMISHAIDGNQIRQYKSSYKQAMEDILLRAPRTRVVSSQAEVQKLYYNLENVTGVPEVLPYLELYSRSGFQFLVLDPQIYISHPEEYKRFSLKLKGFVQFIRNIVPPLAEYPHFQGKLLERFVFEHNDNLWRSMQFLKANKDGSLGKLYVYDLRQCIYLMEQGIKAYQQRNFYK